MTLRVQERQLKIAKLTEHDNIEAYLVTFERMMETYKIPKRRWAFRLVPQLSGRAQQAYAAMPREQAGEYDEVKAVILHRYDITQETYRQRLRAATRKEGETYQELATCLMELVSKWTRDCESVVEVRELIVTEQLLNVLPRDTQIWVWERKPKLSREAGKLADD